GLRHPCGVWVHRSEHAKRLGVRQSPAALGRPDLTPPSKTSRTENEVPITQRLLPISPPESVPSRPPPPSPQRESPPSPNPCLHTRGKPAGRRRSAALPRGKCPAPASGSAHLRS